MKKTTSLALLLLALLPSFLFSQNISSREITEYATTAFSQRHHSLSKEDISVKSIEYLIENGDTLMGIINFTPQGFIIMGMSEKTKPVWAYSTESNFATEDAPAAAFCLINEYKGVIIEDKGREIVDPNIEMAWAQIKSRAKSTKGTPVISPLITATWNQDKYYNQLSPFDSESPSGYDERVPNGCVALAMAMIIYYYRYPETGTGSHTNRTAYGNYTVNFAEQTYNYNAMSDKLNNYNYEVAKLIFHCATSVDMNYAPDGSGAQSRDAVDALRNYFKYHSSINMRNKQSFSIAEWNEKLMNSLDLKRPLYYSGYSDEGGHAFICDGYDEDTLFHFNFGWGGYGNGYFSTDGTGATGGYNSYQSAIFNIYPTNNYPNYCNGTTLITATSGTIEDGSNAEKYANNSSCTYIIAPPHANAFHIKVDYLKTEENQDKLSFWKGNPVSAQLEQTLSGDAKNLSFTIYTDTLYITFDTDDQIVDDGWRISYTVDQDVSACWGFSMLTEHSGIASDGTPHDIEYASNSECMFLLRPSLTVDGANDFHSITLRFNYFDLSPEDELIVYNTEGARELVNIFNGSAPPPTTITYPYTKMRIDFRSDNYLQGNGFEFEWFSNLVASVSDLNKEKIEIYPNPASNYTTIVLPDNQKNTRISLLDITGKMIFSDIIPAGNHKYQLQTTNFATGLYIIKVDNETSVITEKLVIE